MTQTWFAGVDWGSETHHACVLDRDGNVRGERAFPHSGKGLAAMADWLLKCTRLPAGEIGVAIEVPHGPVVESLLERGFAVHSINPKQLDRFRDRFSVAGAKDDRRDAQVLAAALRTDPECLNRVQPSDAPIVVLREVSRARKQVGRTEEPPGKPGPRPALALLPAASGRGRERRVDTLRKGLVATGADPRQGATGA